MMYTRRAAISRTGGLLSAFALARLPPAQATPSSERPLSLAEIIENHTRARGGAAALDSIHAEETEIELTENGSTVEAHYRCTSDLFFRIDIYDKKTHVFCEGLDAQGPWTWPSGKSEPQQGVPDAKRTALEGIEFNLYGLHAFPRRGHQLTVAGRERIALVDYHVIQVDLKDSYQTFLYIDPETWLIGRRRDTRAFHPDVDPTKEHVETQYTDFREVSGVRSAFLQHQVDLGSGEIKQIAAVRKLVYNPEINPAVMTRTYVMG